MVGYGSVASCTLPLLLKHLDMPMSHITVLDCVDKRDKLLPYIQKGLQFVQTRITKQNMSQVLQTHLSAGDLIIDLSVHIDTCDILAWCHDHGVLYINTAVELWGVEELNGKLCTEHTLYWRQMKINSLVASWGADLGPTAILDHGANPGMVSHFAKQGLVYMAQEIIRRTPNTARAKTLEKLLADEDFPRLAMETGTKVLHISERDTQVISQPKQPNEFVNTWSVEGLIEEGLAPAELGWGTHEKTLPHNAQEHAEGPKNQICLEQMGIDTWARSWVPQGEIMGMVIRHGEAYTLSHHLTVQENGKVVYRPTVYYVYCPADYAINSVHELKMRQCNAQQSHRIVGNEIIDGRDELGVLLMGHDLTSWWIGSSLDIHTARELVPGQNATVVQVASSVLSAVVWMIANPNCGVKAPDDLPYKEIIEVARPYLGDVISMQTDWSPRNDHRPAYLHYGKRVCSEADEWQFQSFLGQSH